MSLRPVHLRCEQREDVPCVDHPAPRLGWALESAGSDKRQTAYRIRVGEWWDSGRVESANSVDIAYAGRPLPAAAECVWTVQVWDEAGAVSEWSEPARFRTGLAGWSAQWIGRDRIHDPGMAAPSSDDDPDRLLLTLLGCPYLRRSFEHAGGLRRATLYATARGVVDLELNGTRVGDAVLAPGWTDYRKRIEYAAHDVTSLVREGENVLGAILGPGWYAGFIGFDPLRRGNHYGRDPALLCELHLEHDDGRVEVIASDAAWQATTGPIEYSDMLMGERWDARREPGPWAPVTTAPHDGVPLVPERSQPMRVTEELTPVEVTERAPGVFVFDLGQNMVGGVRLDVEGERGTRVELRFAEMLEDDGSLHLENLRTARALDTYTLRGGGPESFEPRFTFHGFRYVEVRGLTEAPSLTGRVIHSDTPRSGWFECSDDMVNQLWRNINWGQRGNFISVPTDCPQRDERLGWLADAQVFMPTATLNMDVAAFLTKWGDDVLDAQSPEGAYSDVAPRLALERDGAPAWADGGVIVPWIAWRRYGDLRLIERHWAAMERYLAYLERHNPDLLWTERRGNDYGDWLAVGEETPRHVLATAYWAYDAKLMAEMARALGRADRAEHYEALRARIVAAFNAAYVGDDALIEGDTQTAYLLALHMDLLPGRAARAGGGAAGGEPRAPRLPPHDRLRRRRAAVPDAERDGLQRRRPPAAAQRHVPVLGLLDPPRRDDDLGALGRLDRHPRLPDPEDELVQPLLARLRRPVALRVRRRHPRGGARLRARADRARAGRAGVGAGRVPVGPRHDLERVAARGRRADAGGRDPAQRHRHRRRPGRRDRRGRLGAARLQRWAGIVNLVVNDPFKALSHPIRRGIVERLAAGPATVGDATAGFGVSKPAISKHLKVLEETGVVTRVVEGRTHRLSLDTHAMSEAADWMDRQRALWGRLFDVVDEYLKEGNPR